VLDRTNPDTHPAGCQCAACTAYCPTPEEIRAKCAETSGGVERGHRTLTTSRAAASLDAAGVCAISNSGGVT